MPVTDESSVYRLITQEVLPKTIADTNRKNVPYFLYNSGGVRYDIYQGPFTLSNMYQLSPFEDAFYRIDNVPLSTARKLLPVLNREGEMKKRSIILSQEFHQSFYTLDSSVQLTPGYVTKDDYGTDGRKRICFDIDKSKTSFLLQVMIRFIPLFHIIQPLHLLVLIYLRMKMIQDWLIFIILISLIIS